MTRLLWIEASPKGDLSLSSACGAAYLDARSERAPVDVTRRNVWDTELPEFGREAALAKFGPLFGEPHTPEQAAIWTEVVAEIELVRGHDEILVTSPMWNWHVPYALKHWIDVITQPLLSFTLDSDLRHVGTLGDGRPVQLILTRSSAYDGRHPELEDFQEPYLRYIFDMLGYGEITVLKIEPTTRWTPEERAEMRADALAAATAAGEAVQPRS